MAEGFANLVGAHEVPAVSTIARGHFEAFGSPVSGLDYVLEYVDLEGVVEQAHAHFAQEDVVGGIAVFLCTNLGNGPAGTPLCPDVGPGVVASVEGNIVASSVIGPVEQGIAPGDFEELNRAGHLGLVYINVHTDLFPNGEIRGQFQPFSFE